MSSVIQGRGAANKPSASVTVKRPERFKPSTVAHSGVNPLGAFGSFMAKDPIKNVDVRRDEKPKVEIAREYPFMKNRVPTGTQTFTFLTSKLDKDGKLDRQNILTKEPPRNKTDYVSYDPPTSTRPQQKVYDLMMTKPRYAKNHQSTVHWMPYEQLQDYNRRQERISQRSEAAGGQAASVDAPITSTVPASRRSNLTTGRSATVGQNKVMSKTLNNRSSVHHNIISGEPNVYSHEMKPGLLDKQVCNMKLGITQIRDLAGPNAINRNPDYVKAYGESDQVFKRQNGIFTHLYNAAHRFGETEVFKC